MPPVAPAVESAVAIAVVVPVFRHSVFVADAVTSACEQEGAPEHRVVIVDDGCPHHETRRVATMLATAYPERVVYIRRTNGGLSAARNTGVDYALQRWPGLRAIYFLDADNWIEPYTLARAFTALSKGDAQIGWSYPDIGNFGSSEDYADHSGPYSVLRHLTHNLAEAGSMVRREVFDRGCRFDEDMRLGYEDWEFWWQCVEAGFVGRHVPYFGLRYRRRPESMLSESEREDASICSYMKRKHKTLLHPKRLLALEASEAPRYALLLDGDGFSVCTDPREGHRVDIGSMIARYIASHQNAYFHAMPRFIIAASASVMQLLQHLRLDRFALWWLQQRGLGEGRVSFAAIEIAVSSGPRGVACRAMEQGYWPMAEGGLHLIAGDRAALQGALKDASTDWINSLTLNAPKPSTAVLRIEVAGALLGTSQQPGVVFQYLNFFQRLRSEYRQMPPQLPQAKPRYLPPSTEIGNTPQALLQCGPLFPVQSTGGYDLCIALPVVSFGGVEKIARNIAHQFHQAGWRCHLLVLGAEAAALDESWIAEFDSIAFFDDAKLYQWSDSLQYLGSAYPAWIKDGDAGAIEGFLLPMDAMLNFHCASIDKSVAKLRRSGVATCVALQLNDETEFDREKGHPLLAAGYEHAYDLFLPGSEQLLGWCHAIGIPVDKLLLVPNAPGYEVSDDEAAGVLRRRAARLGNGTDAGAVRPQQKLRVLFIGRFDRQKGLDRLAATIARCGVVGLPIEWRIVGGNVIDDDLAPGEVLPVFAEPAIHDAAALTAAYEWADVLLLPSHWEGLPLTLLEAARLGVVAVAARVGAVEEAVADGRTGLVIDDLPCDDFAAAAAEALRRLCEEPGLLRRLSSEAARAMTRNWDDSCRGLIARLTAIVQANRGPPSAAASGG